METFAPLIRSLIALPEAERTPEQVILAKRVFSREMRLPQMPTNVQLLKAYQQLVADGEIAKMPWLQSLLRKRAIRSQSWIVPIQVLTKPFRCPGECIFCPNDASMPKSYINTQPGAMRALLNQFDPYKQVYNRLMSLHLTGHSTDKIEMIVLGGTRDVYPQSYKIEFIKGLYDACNSFDDYLSQVVVDSSQSKAPRATVDASMLDIKYPETIEESIKINETAGQRIIGLTIETRPEYVTDENCRFWRSLGVTRLEMWIQSMDDGVLDANKRGHGTKEILTAMHRVRQRWFKISTHLMPGLYKSNLTKDLETFQIVYSHRWLKSDEVKFYPTAVIPNTPLYDLFKSGEYKPISEDELKEIIVKTKLEIFPPYTRIKRLARDFDSNEVVAGANTPNLRQLVMDVLLQTFAQDDTKRAHQYARLRTNLRRCDASADLLTACATPYIGEATPTVTTWWLAYDADSSFETLVVGGNVDTTQAREFVCLCTRCREMRHIWSSSSWAKGEWSRDGEDGKTPLSPPLLGGKNELLVVRRYRSSNWEEMFLSVEDTLGYLYGFARLLLPDVGTTLDEPGLWAGTALIRELHVYGTVQSLLFSSQDDTTNKAQHKGIGTQLMELALAIAGVRGYHRLSVISGVGVRGYYEKLGYVLDGTYMVKEVK